MIKQTHLVALLLCFFGVSIGLPTPVYAQAEQAQGRDPVSRDLQEMYDRGLAYLLQTQTEDGTWSSGGEAGAGTTALGLLAFLASGDDPNFGLYRSAIRKSLRNLILSQSSETGYMGPSMYHHGFAMLALAEAYGAVDESDLWAAGSSGVEDGENQRSIGQALELAVRSALTSQKVNSLGAWRYSPGAKDADTSVSGAVMMGLLAARNAGIEVSDESIDRALDYFASMTSENGAVGYAGGLSGFGESLARSSIVCLLYSIARRKDLPQYKATETYLRQNLNERTGWIEYTWYYQSQALFQADVKLWETWNKSLIDKLKSRQNPDGSFAGDLGAANSTSMSLLALALNFRFLPIYER
ncbi:Prenyltransferase and squalene oxidase repeat protein [Novipirellula galeiformis]|uniref:Prenyltransferase and squalene oxidase repeat protein n=1 Tax=Novipirellula galeiformis TaxID=2528004 RepID=A0A5C6CTN1_9BACT|nr:prenyltransferase/squalene oxidase repeat-containing protein [Novipirellula galeiformis]TWU26396.1 Prenyltransferase and squalene oxidase repeat protein [Novipirellula galeiformis]